MLSIKLNFIKILFKIFGILVYNLILFSIGFILYSLILLPLCVVTPFLSRNTINLLLKELPNKSRKK